MDKEKERVQKIKRKYGETAFRKWGKMGGNKYLKALGRGDTLIIRKKK